MNDDLKSLLAPCDQLPEPIRRLCRGDDPRVPLVAVNANRATGFAGRIAPLPPLQSRLADGAVLGVAPANGPAFRTGADGLQQSDDANNRGYSGKNNQQRLEHRKSPAVPSYGVGTELEQSFAKWEKYLDIEAEPECVECDAETIGEIAAAGQASCLGCQGLAALLNQLGPDACEKLIDDDPTRTDKSWRIGIVSKIKANAGHHKIKRTGLPVSSLPFFGSVIRRFVVAAIARALEKSLPK